MMSLSPSEIAIIKSTAPILAEHGTSTTTHFYATLLPDTPSLKSVFNTANQANGHQQKALANALNAYASHIEDPSILAPTLELIANKHASLGVTPAQYEVVATYLLAAMKDVLAAACTDAILHAWEKAYWVLADVLIGRERQLYDQAQGWTGWRAFQIYRKVRESDEITSFYLVPQDGKGIPQFKPGQYVSVRVESEGVGQARQYSLSDAPGKEWLRVSVKREEGVDALEGEKSVKHKGYVSNVLHDEKEEGDNVEVSHPYGEFFFDEEVEKEQDDGQSEIVSTSTTNASNGTNSAARNDAPNRESPLSKTSHSDPLVLLSAGVGLTPLLAILTSQLDAKSNRPITFVHTARRTASRAFHTHLLSLAQQYPRLTVIFFTTHPLENDVQGREYDFQGRMDLDALKSSERDVLGLKNERSRYFVCGPTGFMLGTERKLKEWNVEGERVKLELFGTGGM